MKDRCRCFSCFDRCPDCGFCKNCSASGYANKETAQPTLKTDKEYVREEQRKSLFNKLFALGA